MNLSERNYGHAMLASVAAAELRHVYRIQYNAMLACYKVSYWQVLCGRPNKAALRVLPVCLSVRPSVCPVRDPNWRTKRAEKKTKLT